ncbi:MAG: hypothetical protein M3Q22_12680 [Actinomycetota bacterium]|nr:hypothetical protein [Actinomycetota bacterium]
MTTLPDTFAAVLARIEASGHQAGDFDVIGIVDNLMERGTALDDVTDVEFLKLLTQYAREDQTALPCPSWCRYEAGHVFESTDALTDMQVRPHELRLASRDDVYVAVVQEDHRQPGDDSTAVLGPAFVDVQIEGEYETGAALRRLAGELLNAADKLDALTVEGNQ